MWWFLFVSLLTNISIAADCGKAFSLPLKDVLVSPQIPDSYEIGIPAQIGTPPQNIVVLPWIELNNTYIYDSNPICDTTIVYGDGACLVRRGGFFYEDNSSTYSLKTSMAAAGAATQETTNQGAIPGISDLIATSMAGTDDFNLDSTGVLTNFPIGIPRKQFQYDQTTLHPLGLGSNSTFLNTLYKASTIPSRIWSIYWGRMWTTNNPLDGQVVIGGYDESKVTGGNYTQKLDYSNECYTGLKTTITNLVLNFPDGRDVSILTSMTALPACIVPTRPNLLQPQLAIEEAFENATGIKSIGRATGVNWDAMQFYPPNYYNGDITIELDSKMKFRVPNDQFVIPDTFYFLNGSRGHNESLINVAISTGIGQWTALGRYFLTAAYLMIDHDEETFTLWNANPTNATSLQTIVRNESGSGNNCTAPMQGTSSESKTSTGPSKATIAGIAAGILFVVAMILVAVLGCLKRKRRQLKADPKSKLFVREPKPSERLELHNDDMKRYHAELSTTEERGWEGGREYSYHGPPVELHSGDRNGGGQGEADESFYNSRLYLNLKWGGRGQVYEMPDPSMMPPTPVMSHRK